MMTINVERLKIEDPELRELLVGTWMTIGLVADSLANTGELDRDELFARLVTAEADARQSGRQRHMAFAAVRWIFEALGEARQTSREANSVRAHKGENGSKVHSAA